MDSSSYYYYNFFSFLEVTNFVLFYEPVHYKQGSLIYTST